MGCTTTDELRTRPFAWTATYPTAFDAMANCLAVHMAEYVNVTPQLYQREKRAVLTGSVKGGWSMIIEYDVRQISNADTEVRFRQRDPVFNSESNKATAREIADRCATDANAR
jgi:hypothetical protein